MRRGIEQTGTFESTRAHGRFRHDLLVGASDKEATEKQSGTLQAMTVDTYNDTPALDALKASCGAPISMGRGEIPVRLAATSRLFCLRDKK